MSTINIYDLNYTDAFKLGIRNYANLTAVLAVVNIGDSWQALH